VPGTIFLIFSQLHHYDTVNILMLRHCVISLPRTERRRENAENFVFLSTAMLEYHTGVLMVVRSLISVSLPRPKRCRENAGNFVFLSAAMLECYSYFTGVFCEIFNACAQLN